MTFKDHFSGHANIYRDARPHYPTELFVWLASQAPDHDLVWDCGCGNGQASIALATHFREVFASDPSATQIAAAEENPRVHYHVEPAEQTSLASGSASLITVAQALHWFDFARFYADVRRVLKPRGVIAAWSYADCSVTSAIDALKDRVYIDLVGPYWPAERRYVENGYADLPFPFEEIIAPPFEMHIEWTAAQFIAYLRSWSASQRYLQAQGHDAVALVEAELREAWGVASRAVRWALVLRVGRV
ncbi:class I SAM-dependent methyltransferase [Pseudolysobacter antarcticus]|uniref:Class I SAM-dependent methyltransferase n=1 Tax=Pseudolysobacter antarcticus TaxID=2511995 RepID=A0A411HP87_9GAMM|nr:class I SAM-dependent methyltransferase [Pseudolysobacter antarcticus]QBB72303.1 class I SAM-dependent methyltransferase [Pseudolysobacter antarcticus]